MDTTPYIFMGLEPPAGEHHLTIAQILGKNHRELLSSYRNQKKAYWNSSWHETEQGRQDGIVSRFIDISDIFSKAPQRTCLWLHSRIYQQECSLAFDVTALPMSKIFELLLVEPNFSDEELADKSYRGLYELNIVHAPHQQTMARDLYTLLGDVRTRDSDTGNIF